MSPAFHHIEGESCPSCEQKLATCHPLLIAWYNTHVKPHYLNAHVSWGYRDESSQDEAVKEGKSKLPYPQSAHNHTENGAPMSYAVDLFQLVHGQAIWDNKFFFELNLAIIDLKLPIYWGGKWKDLGDFDHFQYRAPLIKDSP